MILSMLKTDLIMKKYLLLLTSLITLTISTYSQKTSITIYNNDFGVVNETRKLQLQKGLNTIKITDIPSQIIPTSVNIILNGSVLEQNYQYDLVSMNSLLNRFIDKEITIVSEKNSFTGKLLSSNGNEIVLQTSDKILTLPNINDYRIELQNLKDELITKPTLVWQVMSNTSSNQDVNLSYMTNSMNWHAEYVGVLDKDEKSMSFNSWVSIQNNSGGSYRNATLKLVAGDVKFVQEEIRGYADANMYRAEVKVAEPEFKQEEFFEYHIYELNNPTTIANNEIKQISLFNLPSVKVEKKYIYSNSYPYNTDGKVAVFIEFMNTKDNNLGLPIPKGKVKIFKQRGEANEFVGEQLIDHTTTGEKIRINTGNAFDIVVENKTMQSERISDRVSENTYSIKIKNRKKEDIVIEVIRSLWGDWQILQNNYDFQRENNSQVVFKIPVKSLSESELIFKVRSKY